MVRLYESFHSDVPERLLEEYDEKLVDFTNYFGNCVHGLENFEHYL